MIYYCDQIGIRVKDRGLSSIASWTSLRLIFVTETVGGDGRVGEYVPMRQKGWKKWTSCPWDYRRQKETLVHKLVHYRFPSMQHGKRFKQRIKEILKGRTFEPQHIHLFGNYSIRYIEGIDLDPVAVVPKEPKKEYSGTLDYFL